MQAHRRLPQQIDPRIEPFVHIDESRCRNDCTSRVRLDEVAGCSEPGHSNDSPAIGHVNDPKNNRSFNRFMYTSPFKAMTTVDPAKRSKTPVSRHPILLSADHEGKRTALRIREYGSGLGAYLFCCMPSSANTIRNTYAPKRIASHNKTG